MDKVLKKLPFPVKLAALGTIPLLFLIYFAAQIIHEKQQRNKVVKEVIANINSAIAVNELATQLHKERRYTVGYILDKATPAELVTQWSRADEAMAKIEKINPVRFRTYQDYSLLSEIKKQRKLVLSKQISSQQALFFYSNVIARIHSFYNTSVDNIPYLQSISKDLKSQTLIFEIANEFGLLRNSVYSMAVRRSFTETEFNWIEKEYKLVNAISTEYRAQTAAGGDTQFANLRKSPEIAYINKTLESIVSERRLPPDFDAEYWWTTTADMVDRIIKIHHSLIENTKTNAENIAEKENNGIYGAIFLLVVIILAVIIIIVYTIRNIDRALQELKLAAEKLSSGETNIELDIQTDDSIGSLAKSIKLIDRSNRELAQAADEIGSGNFNVNVQPRSASDRLGNAVVKMKEDLSQYAAQSTEKIWIQSGLSLINDSVRGEKQINSLTKDALNSLVNYLDAQVGVLYLSEQEHLQFSAGYALSGKDTVPRIIPLGETLVGQAATKKDILYLRDIPEDFVRISTASGESSPRHLIIAPLIHNDVLEGVIELGSYKPFSDAAIALMEQGSVNLAIAIHSAKSRAQLQHLLEETQAQSEELQAQHSELENLNTELEAQAQKLQASEEELKVQQEELLEANQELEERSKMLEEKNELILERNLDIQKKAEELELSTRYKSEFLANMSHELRTPLNSILLLSRLLSENLEKNLTDDQIEYARVIQSSGNGLLSLIDEILDLSKIEAGKMDLEFAETSVREITGDMRALFSPIAKEKNLELRVEVAADIPEKIVTDKMRLEQILKNLLANALKFTSRGFVELSVTQPAGSLYLNFSVKDTGIGIPDDKQKHIFEAFQQADGSTKRKFGGTGLGLSISKELSRLLGGEITLNSKPAEGSEFTVTIPVHAKKVETKELPVQPPAPAGEPEQRGKTAAAERKKLTVNVIPQPVEDDRNALQEGDKTILIVEDDTNFAKSLLSFTRKSGYKGMVAVRGDTGIEMAKTFRPTAILLDIQLPVKDGWEVMEELKSNPSTKHIPVHIMSSLEAKKESLTKGAVDFINKPVAIEQMQQIFAKLENALQEESKKVLIIEENSKHAKALSYFLETFNVRSEIRDNVPDGVSALQQKEVNCVILDMGIPDHAGYQTLEEIKKNKGLEDIPIIIFTGKNLSKAEETRLKQYAETIVMKTAHSYQRILDEVALFLHLVEEKNNSLANPEERKNLLELNEVLKGKTVLIADDDVRNIFSLTKALEQVKMKVLSATDGKEALRVLEENPQTQVVLMDMMMPEMDGYETTTRIRQNPRYKNLPILAVTAKAMIGDREKCIRAGASDYISKPVDVDQLISLLRVWLYDKHQ